MARKIREKSETGIYHVILRGINKQDIFLEEEDFTDMLRSLQEAQAERSEDGKVMHRNNCTYYAYCILHNHIHILLREGKLPLSDLMKRIENRFVRLYNTRYERVGHLFQDRFLSEPVNEHEYFYQLLRYIHRNPVKAMEASSPEDYRFTSWHEYLYDSIHLNHSASDSKPTPSFSHRICNTSSVFKRYGARDLIEWVNMDVDDKCMDMDMLPNKISDATAWEILSDLSGAASAEEFKQYRPEVQLDFISSALDHGITLLQASRLSSLSYSTLHRKLKGKKPEQE